MKMRPNEFPEHRLRDLKRQAELAVYRDLEASALPGIAVYSASPAPASPEVDFAVWLTGAGRFAVEVKGGRYSVVNGHWFLAGPGGRASKPNPLMQGYDAGMGLRNAISERLSHRRKPYVICATLFPDMERDEDIEACVEGSQSKVLWGSDDVAGRLAAIAAGIGIDYPPTAREAEAESALLLPGDEVALLLPGLDCQRRGDLPPTRPELVEGLGLDARQVIIQHVENLHIHTSAPEGVTHG